MAQWTTPLSRTYDSYDDYAASPILLEVRHDGVTVDSRPLDLSYHIAGCELDQPDRASLFVAIFPDFDWVISTGHMSNDDHECWFAIRPAPEGDRFEIVDAPRPRSVLVR
jgi:hypothetical protein